MNEYAIFTAVVEQRRVIVDARTLVKAARRDTARTALAGEGVPVRRAGRLGHFPAAPGGDASDAWMPMPDQDASSDVEFL